MGYAPKRFPKHEAFDLNSNLMFVDKLKMIIEKGVGGTIPWVIRAKGTKLKVKTHTSSCYYVSPSDSRRV